MSQIPIHGYERSNDIRCESGGAVRALDKTPVTDPASLPVTTKKAIPSQNRGDLKPLPFVNGHHVPVIAKDGVGAALSDTPAPSAPSSPRIPAMTRTNSMGTSTASTPRIRPTTLDIPGLTKSKVSPDGRIAQRDVGSKLVIVMVGLPARGKSYITKKMARYLNWLQHDTKIFNVGERRRVAAGGQAQTGGPTRSNFSGAESNSYSTIPDKPRPNHHQIAAQILINGHPQADDGLAPLHLPSPVHPHVEEHDDFAVDDTLHAHLEAKFPEIERASTPDDDQDTDAMDQSASFFDPQNKKAALIREQCAMETLDDLLDYILIGNGSVGIFDATNSTLNRRKQIMIHIRERAGPELNVLFVESVCQDQRLLESNMRLKLSGPDYDGKDPVAALEDFRKRVAIYEKNYVPLGDYEEENNMPFVKMVDVGRKVISHQIRGFLSSTAVYYLLNFNLTPRMIWITRHGESLDNVAGKIGGDSDLSANGTRYAKAMTKFIDQQRKEWDIHQADKFAHTHFPPHPGDHTPPNPHYGPHLDEPRNFCVWTSMLKRSIQSAQYFDEEDYETKQMRMLDELNAGIMEGLTYDEIRSRYEEEFSRRRKDKMGYRYPGPGGEGYLDVINRLRPVIVELERMTDHCLLVAHRSVARVLLAYFQNLDRKDVADLECPLGMLYQLEPKPYGVEFKAWRYNSENDGFDLLPDYKLHRATYAH
ncbi:bifunctional 6-phosphofructo-2-kinase/fructose-2,6-bisphosphate 2-phosphatase [Mytilinidion resinicola]|uniref:Bifunctional 6-phosphofructo-2-kinase/fructose-2,6-bisphosphate 2-phosphatase n=1 Tax=Mytilinidion resinicola TaxID=574789 RepID=A0A6A6YP85_9PEZI|nr:bifunctional 6-phosphofructo-2-kinase/fructose-2,6-bisphosphate 2-phosphatase [Mytilinidion resinicola]KAF2810706.1 bifunctional 6-phosphofructo-2-kinase/fructose-2,6-bisphosphate 2-phosphatase [Mytilinidion resinicola]